MHSTWLPGGRPQTMLSRQEGGKEGALKNDLTNKPHLVKKDNNGRGGLSKIAIFESKDIVYGRPL